MKKRIFSIIIFALILLCKITQAPALTPIVSLANQPTYNLSNHMEMYIDKTHRLSIDDVTNVNFTNQFVPYNQSVINQYQNYGANIWLRFQVNNPSDTTPQFFLTGDFINTFKGWALYTQTNNQPPVKFSITPHYMHLALFPLTIAPHSSQVFYLFNHSESLISTNFSLAKPFTYLLSAIDQYFAKGIGYGVLFSLLFNSILIFIFLRDKNYFSFIVFLVASLIMLTLIDGFFNRFSELVLNNWWYVRTSRAALLGTASLYLLFTSHLLETKSYLPRLSKFITICIWSVLPVAILCLLPNFGYYQFTIAQKFSTYSYVLSTLIICFCCGIIISRKAYKPAYYYLVGMLFALSGFILDFFIRENFITATPLLLQVPELALFANMLMLSIGLAVRFDLMQQSEIETQKSIIKQKDLNAKLQTEALEQQKRLLTAYTRFFPNEFLSLLQKKSILNIALGDNVEKNLTILFADLRPFMHTAHQLSLEDNFSLLNNYLTEVSPLVRENRGFIDKYVGDAVLALFNESAEDALFTAIKIIEKIQQVSPNEKINMGIGVHHGPVIVGTIGEQERMDATVISDAVNTASRIQSLTEIYNAQIIISDQTIATLKSPQQFKIRFLDRILAKGKHVPIQIYEVFDNDSAELIKKKLSISTLYHEGIAHYQKQEFHQALNNLTQCQAILPDDHVIQRHIQRCELFIEQPPDSNWTAITRLQQKIEII